MSELVDFLKLWLPRLFGSALIGYGAWALIVSLFDPKGLPAVKAFAKNWIGGAIGITAEFVTEFAGTLKPIADALVTAVEHNGGPILQAFEAPLKRLTRDALSDREAELTKSGVSTPDNALSRAADAMGGAFGFGLASHATTAMFESLLPKDANCLNGVGPMLAELAGFKEVAGAALDPLYENAFGKSLEYHYAAQFKPEFPKEDHAIGWHSKRLLSDAQLKAILPYYGLKEQFEQPYIDAAYHTVQPRALTQLFEDTPFPLAQVKEMLEFTGIRDKDLATLLTAYEWQSTKNLRHQLIAAVIAAGEKTTIDDIDINSQLDALHFSDTAKNYVHTIIDYKRLDALAELYRRSVTALYETGQLTDAQYLPALDAIGIAPAFAHAYYAIDSARLKGKILAQQEREQGKAEERVQREQIAATKVAFLDGVLPAIGASAALIAIGLPGSLASAMVSHWEAMQHAALVDVYGLRLARAKAELLREKVAAVKEQFEKKLMPLQAVIDTLHSFDLPDPNIQALISEWAAQSHKEVLPP